VGIEQIQIHGQLYNILTWIERRKIYIQVITYYFILISFIIVKQTILLMTITLIFVLGTKMDCTMWVKFLAHGTRDPSIGYNLTGIYL